MDKNAIKKYAVWAREELLSRVRQRAFIYGITEKGITPVTVLSDRERRQLDSLIRQIKAKGFTVVIEEIAYIWFNRFCALRFMEVNDYLPYHIRVFTDGENRFKPQILEDAIHLDIEGLDKEKVYALKESNADEALYRYLLTVLCNAMHSYLPGMFSRIDDNTELLMPDHLLMKGSILDRLISDIPENDWAEQVQIIGWLYQYYNSASKDQVFADLKKNIKVSKEHIPAATQLFTPEWIVKYMVENSLGRLWLEGHPDAAVQAEWKYYLPDAEQSPDVQAQIQRLRKSCHPEEIRCIDPCAGSGHILCYMFDVLMQLYTAQGYPVKEAVRSILQNNLWGLDLDERAAQLAYFSVMMKAREYDRRFFRRAVQPHILHFQGLRTALTGEELSFVRCFENADIYGTLMELQDLDAERIREAEFQDNIETIEYQDILHRMADITEALSQKYDIVVTNPPYMGSGNMHPLLKGYLEKNYPDGKTDLYSAFMERCFSLSKKTGYIALITPQSWLSLSSFTKLRKHILQHHTLYNAILLTKQTFESGLQAVSFVTSGTKINGFHSSFVEQTGIYFSDHPYQAENAQMYHVDQDSFQATERMQFMYDASNQILHLMQSEEKLRTYAIAKPGMQTSDNDRFLRYWYEVGFRSIGFGLEQRDARNSDYPWFPYHKGIGYRKWYGNHAHVVNYYHDGEALKYWLTHNPNDPSTKSWSRNLRNYDDYFKEGITFTAIGQQFSARLNGRGFLFDTKGPMIFGTHLEYICGFTNTCVFAKFNKALCKQATKSFDSVNEVPLRIEHETDVTALVQEAITLSKQDWDSFETSWDFSKHPLV